MSNRPEDIMDAIERCHEENGLNINIDDIELSDYYDEWKNIDLNEDLDSLCRQLEMSQNNSINNSLLSNYRDQVESFSHNQKRIVLIIVLLMFLLVIPRTKI